MDTIKAFLSYSHDSDAHRARVLALSERLRKDGIETILDQYVRTGSPAEGWPRWMLNGLNAATRVLCVCTETYRRRFLGQEVSGKGKGADWEGSLLTDALYEARNRTNKFIPVLFESAHEPHIPEPLRSRTHYLLDSEAGYKALYDALLGRTGVEPGAVGELRSETPGVGEAADFGKGPDKATGGGRVQSPVALKIWQDKLDFFLVQEAVCVDPEMKFRMKHLIDEARERIEALQH